MRLLLACAGAWVVAFVIAASVPEAQGPPAPGGGPSGGARTVRDGIYTEAQADRGQKTYDTLCIACHELTLWRDTWVGRPLSEVFLTIRMDMPEDNPGSLSPAQARDLLAHILRTNEFPAGAELSDDPVVLREIRIERPAP